MLGSTSKVTENPQLFKTQTFENLIAIDPGPTHSALVEMDGDRIAEHLYAPNEEVRMWLLRKGPNRSPVDDPAPHLVVEKVASYGMPVGEEVFATVHWGGRFTEAYGHQRTHHLERLRVKLALCRDSRAKDANIRQALIDRYGGTAAIGRKATPGPLYGISGDLWAALALAIAFREVQP